MDIYVSYSNVSEKHVKLITQIVEKLKDKGYNVISSIDEGSLVQPFESISDAERQYLNAKNIVIFVSDKYMRQNPHCLHELHYILKKADDKVIMPIRLLSGGFLDKAENDYIKDSVGMLYTFYNKGDKRTPIEDRVYEMNTDRFNPDENCDNTECTTPKDIKKFFKDFYTDRLKVRIEDNVDVAVEAIVQRLQNPLKSETQKEPKTTTNNEGNDSNNKSEDKKTEEDTIKTAERMKPMTGKEIREAQKFVNAMREESAKNASTFKTIGLCVLVGNGLVGFIDVALHNIALTMLIMGGVIIVLGFLPTLLIFLGCLTRYKNNLSAKMLTETLLVEYKYSQGDFEGSDETTALGVFAKKFQSIKNAYEQGEIEAMEKSNELINKQK